MSRAIVVYRSRTGTTRRFADEIASFLRSAGVETQVASVGEADPASLANADYVLLGAWTSGLFVVAQHPDEPWVAFVRDMPSLARRSAATTDGTAAAAEAATAAGAARRPATGPAGGPRVGLFTTYRLVSGSMFARMRGHLAGKTGPIELELKSRDGRLSAADRTALEAFIGPR